MKNTKVLSLNDFYSLYAEFGEIYIEKKYKEYQEQFIERGISPFWGFFDLQIIQKIEEMR